MKKICKFLLLSVLAVGISFSTFYVIKKYIINENNVEQKKKVEEKKEEKPKEVYPKITKASMIMTGDALIHNSVYKDAALGDGNYDFTKQMEYIAPIIKNYDLAFYNQETIIGGKDLGISTYPRFNSPDEIGDCMVGLGFNIVNLSTNHTLDKGEKGILYSLNYWKNKDVLTAGSYESEEDRITPRIKEVNGIKYTDEKAKEDIERVRDKVDVIFVSMHWGTEYNQDVDESQKRIAQYLSDLGVNVIIGTHPHVLEPIQYINNTLVIYSLGNFISAQVGPEKLTGALVSLNITKTLNEDKSSIIELSDVNAELIYTSYKKSSGYWTDFKVMPYTQLTDDILYNYKNYYNKFSSILTKYDNSITITSLE